MIITRGHWNLMTWRAPMKDKRRVSKISQGPGLLGLRGFAVKLPSGKWRGVAVLDDRYTRDGSYVQPAARVLSDAAVWLTCTGVLLAALWALVRFVPGP